MNGTKLILDDQGNHLDSYTISLELFRSFRGPLLHKPVNGQELFFAVSYSKPALPTHLLLSMYLKNAPLTTSNEFQFVTDGEKPGGPPKNVRITGLTSTNLEVTWDDPDQRLQHGIVTRYNLGYREYK